ncbi:hypothetical protein B0H17DRAFT_1162310 [Mycena rosella]|uniref:Uncharacterized protein n=1 Tax=Mycena rosella TaxID=1033263 RepID=A0AAD7G563_MYCRO|nr:hypothetical protein B0H17DRAFT_1162310 [Mycena rosella]
MDRNLPKGYAQKFISCYSLTRFREIREALGLFRSRKDGHDIESIRPAMLRLRQQYPKAEAREIVNLLVHEENMNVSRNLITEYFAMYEPELVKEGPKNRLRRKRFWTAVDQHDKWKYRFGLALHSGIDPFIGRIRWMKIWWTNSNPRLILIMPLVSQSDPGTENFGLADGHTLLRHLHDPDLEGTLQHRWMREKKNVMPEIGWSQLHHQFTSGFEDILDMGVTNGWYDPGDLVETLVFRWLFIPWLQKKSIHIILPHGVPNDMYEHPGDYRVLDFKVCTLVNLPEAIDEVRALHAAEDHNVFQLVPPDFHAIISQMYDEMGQPPVTRATCWDIYLRLLTRFRALDEAHDIPHDIDAEWGYALTMAGDYHAEDIELIPDLQPLRNGDEVVGPDGSYYMGGVNNGEGLDAEKLAQLDQMINEDEPRVEDHLEQEGAIFVLEISNPAQLRGSLVSLMLAYREWNESQRTGNW